MKRFEQELLEMMELKHASILKEIADKRDLTDALTASLKQVLTDFTASFKASVKA